MLPAGPIENAPWCCPAGIDERSLNGIGSTLSARIFGPPPDCCLSPGAAASDLFPGDAADAAVAGCGVSWAAGWGGAAAAWGTGGAGFFTGGGGAGTSSWGTGIFGSGIASASWGGGGGGGAISGATCGTIGTIGGAGILGCAGTGGGAGFGLAGVALSTFAGAGVGDLATAGIGAGPPEIKSGIFKSFGSLRAGGAFSVFRVRRELSGLGGLEIIVTRGSKRVLPKRGRTPGFAPRPGAFPWPGG